MKYKKRKFWTETELESLKLDYPKLSEKELEEKYGRSMNSLRGKAIRLGINRPYPAKEIRKKITRKSKLTNLEIENLYNKGMNTKELSELTNVGRSRISSILRENNVILREGSDYRIHTVVEDFFDIINTEEKAYILGFLYADGYNNTTNGSVRVSLHIKDKVLLEKISTYLTSNIVKTYSTDKGTFCQIEICSKKLSLQLEKLGCVKAKSLILQFPTEEQVPKEFQRHFIRGYFDGDGCISIGKKGFPYFSITSTLMFNEKLQEVLLENCKDLKKGGGRFYKNNITYDVRYSSKSNILKIKEFIYKDATLYLERKFDKFNLIN